MGRRREVSATGTTHIPVGPIGGSSTNDPPVTVTKTRRGPFCGVSAHIKDPVRAFAAFCGSRSAQGTIFSVLCAGVADLRIEIVAVGITDVSAPFASAFPLDLIAKTFSDALAEVVGGFPRHIGFGGSPTSGVFVAIDAIIFGIFEDKRKLTKRSHLVVGGAAHTERSFADISHACWASGGLDAWDRREFCKDRCALCIGYRASCDRLAGFRFAGFRGPQNRLT